MDLPPHPDTQDSASAEPARSDVSVRARIVIGVLVALVVVVIVLHLTGVVGPLAD
jgi:hypothetical protein